MRLKPQPTKVDALAAVIRKIVRVPIPATEVHAKLRHASRALGFDALKDRNRLSKAKARADVESKRIRGGKWAWQPRQAGCSCDCHATSSRRYEAQAPHMARRGDAPSGPSDSLLHDSASHGTASDVNRAPQPVEEASEL